MPRSREIDMRVLVLAPLGRDAEVAVSVLEGAGILGAACEGPDELLGKMEKGTGAAMIAEEALTVSLTRDLQQFLARQPDWSDIPLIFLTSRGNERRSVEILDLFGTKGNINLLERTFKPVTLLSVVKTALRSRQKQYQVRDLIQELKDFTAVASHDLRAPIRTIRMFADLLERKADRLDPEGRQYLRFIRDSSGKMHQLIADLLEFTKITHSAGLRQTVDLRAAAEEVVESMRGATGEKDARVEIGDLPAIEANGQQMKQVFQNLIENGLKYNESPEPRVRIDSVRTDTVLEIRVRDNGIGLEQEDCDRIFEPFLRLHGEEYAGTGMGLAICRKVVENLGGRISVTSEPGAGSAFLIRLPASVIREQAPEPAAAPESPAR